MMSPNPKGKPPLYKSMVWLAGLSAVFLGLTGILVVIGLSIPSDYHNSYSVVVSLDRAALWQALSSPKSKALWDEQIVRSELVTDTRQARASATWRDIYPDQTEITYTIDGDQTSYTLLREVNDPKIPFRFSWTLKLLPQDSKTLLIFEEKGEIENPLLRLIMTKWIGEDLFAKRFLARLEQFDVQTGDQAIIQKQ